MSSIEDVLNQYNVPSVDSSHHHVGSGWIGVDCPFCSPGWMKYRMAFSLSTGRCNCWTCGRADAAEALSVLCGITKGAAIELSKGLSAFPEPLREHTGTLKNPSGVDFMTPAHWNYLVRRELPAGEIENLWGVKGIGVAPRLGWRLFIPIFDRHGRQVSWTTRAIHQSESRRYISAAEDEEAIPHKSILYGAQLARHAISIHEGPADAWKVGPGAVATCGTSYSVEQVAEMVTYPVRVVCFDSSAEAQKRAVVLANQLAAFPGTTQIVELESGEDAADAQEEELDELRALIS